MEMIYRNNELLAEKYIELNCPEEIKYRAKRPRYLSYLRRAWNIKNAKEDILKFSRKQGGLSKLVLEGIGPCIKEDLRIVIRKLEEERKNERGENAKRGKTTKRAG